MEVLATRVLAACRAKGWTVATAESCTGGMVAAALTEITGSSDVFECGFVTYSNAAKMRMLGVSSVILENFGAVSPEVAAKMATGALTRAGVDLAVAITGIAGPGRSDHKPEGRVCFALARAGQTTQVETVEFGAIGRRNVRLKSSQYALTMLLNIAKEGL